MDYFNDKKLKELAENPRKCLKEIRRPSRHFQDIIGIPAFCR